MKKIEAKSRPLVAIACGGTGGHLFPGLAVAEALSVRGCRVMLLVSSKEVDQQAVQSARGMEVVALPAVGLNGGRVSAFASGFARSFRAARAKFKADPPKAVLAMGGFTSAPPVLAGKLGGAKTFFHESNAIPGRANRWLAPIVDEAFVGFASATDHLLIQRARTTGTPVRPQFDPQDPGSCRMALGLDPRRPVLLVMGGSQGATAINELATQALPQLVSAVPDLQYLHLTGPNDLENVRAAYLTARARALVRPFLTEMELAMGAATVAVTRAGASTLAELAAMRLPAMVIPYPTATDNHQYYNAVAMEQTGAAMLCPQRNLTPAQLARSIHDLIVNEERRTSMKQALAKWHSPQAAETIADVVLKAIGCREALARRNISYQNPAGPILPPLVQKAGLAAPVGKRSPFHPPSHIAG